MLLPEFGPDLGAVEGTASRSELWVEWESPDGGRPSRSLWESELLAA